MEKNLDLRDWSSSIAEVIGRLRTIIRDAENSEINHEMTLMRVRENADIALEFMDQMREALKPDETD
jgi:hypothetical protein